MHELALAEDVVEAILAKRDGGRITRVVVEVGKLAAVVPEAFRFCFEVASDGTPAAGAELSIVETPGRGRCRACTGEVDLQVPYGVCGCGSADLDLISGTQLRIREMEVV